MMLLYYLNRNSTKKTLMHKTRHSSYLKALWSGVAFWTLWHYVLHAVHITLIFFPPVDLQ